MCTPTPTLTHSQTGRNIPLSHTHTHTQTCSHSCTQPHKSTCSLRHAPGVRHWFPPLCRAIVFNDSCVCVCKCVSASQSLAYSQRFLALLFVLLGFSEVKSRKLRCTKYSRTTDPLWLQQRDRGQANSQWILRAPGHALPCLREAHST